MASITQVMLFAALLLVQLEASRDEESQLKLSTEEEGPEAALREELSGMKVMDLHKRAVAGGLSDDEIEDAMEAHDSKQAFTDLIVQHETNIDSGQLAELYSMKITALHKKAVELGSSDKEIEDAFEAGDTREAFTKLVMAREAIPSESVGTPIQPGSTMSEVPNQATQRAIDVAPMATLSTNAVAPTLSVHDDDTLSTNAVAPTLSEHDAATLSTDAASSAQGAMGKPARKAAEVLNLLETLTTHVKNAKEEQTKLAKNVNEWSVGQPRPHAKVMSGIVKQALDDLEEEHKKLAAKVETNTQVQPWGA